MIMAFQGRMPKIGRRVYIAPTAMIIGDVEIAEGASIWFGAVLRGDMALIRVGRDTNIQDNCTVHVDYEKPAIIGDRVTVGHNAVIHGCTIEEHCLIGINAVVLSDAHICKGSVVAAASVVREGQKVGPHHLVAGTPAVLKREMPAASIERITQPVRNYLENMQMYLEDERKER